MGEYPGAQTVFIVDDVTILDEHGDPVLDEYLNEQVTERVLRVDGCLLESLTVSENQAETTVTADQARAFLPVVDSCIPALTADDEPVEHPWQDLTSRSRIRCNGLEYEMRGDPVLEVDLDGMEDHVLAKCERRDG